MTTEQMRITRNKFRVILSHRSHFLGANLVSTKAIFSKSPTA